MNVLDKIKSRKLRPKGEDDKEIAGVTMAIYKNLRRNYRDLTDTILGENYYNTAMDVYTCDNMITDDIKYKYNNMKNDLKLCKKILIIALDVIFILIAVLIYLLLKLKGKI